VGGVSGMRWPAYLLGRVGGFVAAAWAEARRGWQDGYTRQRYGPPKAATFRLPPLFCPDPSAHRREAS